jgi:hypothetical protein
MKVFVMDSKLRKHSVDVHDGASVAHVKRLLADMLLLPAGLVPKLVYQQRMLGDDECIGGIGYSLERSISLVCVRSTPASAAAGPELHSVSSLSTEPNTSVAARQAPASAAADASTASAAADASTASADIAVPFPQRPAVFSPSTSVAAAASSVKSSTYPSSAAQPAAQFAAATALTVEQGSRVRIEGLQAAPEMNGRTGTVCGAFNQESGRWAVDVDAEGARRACRGTFRPGNLRVIAAHNFATEWLDEDGRVCPKNVDYATQCPKGHALAPLVCRGDPQPQQTSDADVICRVCHGLAQRQHTRDWLQCSVAACCGGYAVCAACVIELGSARRAAAARADDFCMLVMLLACELKQCFLRHVLLWLCFLFCALTAIFRACHCSICSGCRASSAAHCAVT